MREADATTVAATARKHKVSERTIYAWRKHFGGLTAVDAKRLRTLEAENARLKRLLAEGDLDISVLKEINAKKWCARRRGARRSRSRANAACPSGAPAGW